MQGLRHFSRRIVTICWTSVAIIIILFALLVSVTRMLMPLVADYRGDLEQLASEQLGRPVTVDSINAEWVGLWPQIHLSGVRIQSKETSKDWLQVADVWLSLDLLSLVRKGRLDTRRVRVDGLQLDVQRVQEAVYVINGESFRMDQSSPADQAGLLRWLFSRDQLQLQDSRFAYRDEHRSRHAIEISGVNVTLQNTDDLHHAYGRFTVPAQQDSRLSFVIDMHGDMLRPQDVHNKFYLQGDIKVSRGMQEWLKPYVNIEQGAFNMKLWGAGSLQRLEHASAEVHALDLAWSYAVKQQQDTRSEIDELQARVFWKRHDSGWNLDIEDFTLAKQDRKWPQSEIHLVYRDQTSTGLMSLEGTIGYVRLEDVSGLLSRNLPDNLAISEDIRQVDMRGILQSTKFRIQRDHQGIRDLYFNSAFNDLGFERWQQLPGVRGMDGSVILMQDKGELHLDSKDTIVDLGDLFKERLQVSNLHGDIYWQTGTSGLELSFDSLVADNAHVETVSRAKIIIPANGDSPFIDMDVDFDNGQAKFASLYLPRRIMGKNTVKWLDKAFVTGSVTSGKMIFHGRAMDYPFVNKPGTFMVGFDVNDVQLNYGDSWPQLQQVDANVLFKENSLAVKIHNGNVMQVGMRPSLLEIDSLGDQAVLDMDLSFAGRTQQLINYLRDSPAGKNVRDTLADISADGDMDSQVKLSIPLGQPDDYRLQGRTHFRDGNLHLKKWQYELTDFKGDLLYTRDGNNIRYTSDNLHGRFLGKPAQLRVNTTVKGKQAPLVAIELRARLGLSQLSKAVLPQQQDIFTGLSDWRIVLNLQDKATTLWLKSDLVGEEVRLPGEFSKRAKSKRNLHIKAKIGDDRIKAIEFSYGDIVAALLRMDGKRNKAGFTSAAIRFGKGKRLSAAGDGIVIGGHLGNVDVNQWLDLYPGGENDLTMMDAMALITQADLSINRLLIGQLQYNKLSVIATRRPADMLVTIGAKEVAGEVTIPVGGKAPDSVEMNLKYLYLTTTGQKLESSVPDPRKFPAIKLVTDKLFLNGNKLGKLDLHVGRIPQGLEIDKLELHGELIRVSAAGSWLFKQSWHESTFSMNFKTPAIGDAMKLFDFQTSIDDGEADAHLQASWSGPPHWFEMKRLNGTLKIAIKKGQLRDINPGGGRIFGLLSVQSLQRRLFLDFSDLFKKGFSFDKIEGLFRIADGDAYTNDLFLDGPAARIDIAGRIGLAAEDYDEEIVITPKLSSSIPVLGLAAGPQVAIGLLLTEKILRKDINKISRTHYTLTGSWESPEINKIAIDSEQEEEFVEP